MKPRNLLIVLLVLVASSVIFGWRYRNFYRASSVRVKAVSIFDESFGVRLELPFEPGFTCPGATCAWEGQSADLVLVRAAEGSAVAPPVPAQRVGEPSGGRVEVMLRVPLPEGHDPLLTTSARLRDPLFGERTLVAGFRSKPEGPRAVPAEPGDESGDEAASAPHGDR